MGTVPSGLELNSANAPNLPEAHLESKEVLLWDTDNPQSLINLVSPKTKKAMQDALFEQGQYFEMDELSLYKKLRDEAKSISPTDNRLRLKFWMEYDHAITVGSRQMLMNRVTAGVCSEEYFYNRYLSDPAKVAWLVCPPTGYMIKVNEGLEFGLEKMREILSMSIIGPGGKIDTKLGELQLKIVQMFDVRIKGAPVQRNLTVNANLHGKAAAAAVAGASAQLSMEELEKRLLAAKKREQELLNGQVIVVKPETQQS